MADRTDMFPNILTRQLSMSASNTLTFDEIEIGLNIFDKAGLIISRIEYFIGASTIEDMTTAGDDVVCALTSSDTITALSAQQTEIIDSWGVHRHDMGTAASGVIRPLVEIHDFSTMSGGGILVAPKPLHIAMTSAGLAAAGSTVFRIYFRVIRLSDAQYLELLETRRAFQ